MLHIPGPWKVGKPDADFCGSVDYPHMVVLDYGMGPCNRDVVASRMTEDDAHIIAASPEMLAALKAWEHWYNVDSSEFNRDNARDMGLKAISKAERS